MSSTMEEFKRGFSSLLGWDKETSIVAISGRQSPAKASEAVPAPAPIAINHAISEADVTQLEGAHGVAEASRELAAKANVLHVTLTTALGEADAAASVAVKHISTVEAEWAAKIGEFVQKNADMRIEAKQATRRAAAAETALDAAKARIAELELALTDVALHTSEESHPREHSPSVAHVQSLGAGHGGFDLGGGTYGTSTAGDNGSSSSPAAVDVNSLISSPAGGPSELKSSPPKLSLDPTLATDARDQAVTKGGGCCSIS